MRVSARNSFAPVKLSEAEVNFFPYFIKVQLTQTIMVVQEPQSLSDDFAGGLIKTALNFLRNELFQCRRQRHIHNLLSAHFIYL